MSQNDIFYKRVDGNALMENQPLLFIYLFIFFMMACQNSKSRRNRPFVFIKSPTSSLLLKENL